MFFGAVDRAVPAGAGHGDRFRPEGESGRTVISKRRVGVTRNKTFLKP